MSTPEAAAPATPSAPAPAPALAPAQGLSPERLDQVISTTSPRGWIALIAVFVIVLATLIWSIVASLSQQTTALGVVSSLAYTETVTATTEGIFNAAGLLTTAQVQKGQVIGTIAPYDGSAPVNITASATGTLGSVGQYNGSGVKPGDVIANVEIAPDPAKGIIIITYLSANDASTYFPGQSTTVSITNLAQSATTSATATVVSVASTPSNNQAMLLQADTEATVNSWQKQAGGEAYAVILSIASSADIQANLVPRARQLVQIVNTYGSVHPIDLLFGAK